MSSDKSLPFRGPFFSSSEKFNKFDAGNVILFQTKLFARNIKETTLVRYFIKITARPSFTQLSVIRYENRKYVTKIPLHLLSYLNLLDSGLAAAVLSSHCFATLLKSNFSMSILLYISSIFSEHLFLRTSLDGYWQRLLIRPLQ